MMKRSSLVRLSAAFALSIAMIPVLAQDTPTFPVSQDLKLWAKPNSPYILSQTQTTTTNTFTGKAKIYRNSSGVVREESFYNSGKLSTFMIREAGKDKAPITTTFCNVVPKTCFVTKQTPPMTPRSPYGYSVEKLGPRQIAGFESQGLRFTRTIPASADGKVPARTTVEDDWVSNELGVVLEQTNATGTGGSTTKTVMELQKVEPDPALFTIPEGYTMLPPQGQPAPQQQPAH